MAVAFKIPPLRTESKRARDRHTDTYFLFRERGQRTARPEERHELPLNRSFKRQNNCRSPLVLFPHKNNTKEEAATVSAAVSSQTDLGERAENWH